jgi:large subunit ribosomal protein L24
MKIKTGDHVKIIAGKDRGKVGTVLRVDRKAQRVFVEGRNIVKRHERPRQVPETQRSATVGGVVEAEGPIHVSNVALLDPEDQQPTRIGIDRSGARPVRVAKRSGKQID